MSEESPNDHVPDSIEMASLSLFRSDNFPFPPPDFLAKYPKEYQKKILETIERQQLMMEKEQEQNHTCEKQAMDMERDQNIAHNRNFARGQQLLTACVGMMNFGISIASYFGAQIAQAGLTTALGLLGFFLVRRKEHLTYVPSGPRDHQKSDTSPQTPK